MTMRESWPQTTAAWARLKLAWRCYRAERRRERALKRLAREYPAPTSTLLAVADAIAVAEAAGGDYLALAHAALKAISEPTEEMLDGLTATGKMWRDMNSREVYCAMWRAAVGERV